MDPRKKEFEESRKMYAISEIEKLGYTLTDEDDQSIKFEYKGQTVTFWAYTGLFSGKTVRDARGIKNLINQIK